MFGTRNDAIATLRFLSNVMQDRSFIFLLRFLQMAIGRMMY